MSTPALRVNGLQIGPNSGVAYVTAYGAKGDGATDDTAAIQAAITAVIGLNGGTVFFPPGTYKITSALTIPQVAGARILGASRYGTVISQATANTPIFLFDTCNSHSFEVSGMTLTWASSNPSTNTSAIAIYFRGNNGSGPAGFYNFTIRDLFFMNGFRSIATNASANQVSCWGYTIENIWHDLSMTGAAVFMVPNPSCGQPNVCIRDLYARADNASEAVIKASGWHPALLDHVEIEVGSVGPSPLGDSIISLTNCTDVVMNSVQTETMTITQTGYCIILLAATTAVINGLDYDGLSTSAGITGYGVLVNGGGLATINGYTLNCTTFGAGSSLYAMSGAFAAALNLALIGTIGPKFFKPGSTARVNDLNNQTQTIAAAASITVDPTAGGNVRINLGATAITSLTISAGLAGDRMTVTVAQDGTGGRSIPTTWTNVRFAGGTYTATATANKIDCINFRYDSTASAWLETSRAMNQ